jgi:hypothetical protein
MVSKLDGMYLGDMTKEMSPVPMTGGPSDGKKFRPVTKWPMYLDAEGERLQASIGDRIMNGRSARKGCYVAQRDLQTCRVTSYAWRTVV